MRLLAALYIWLVIAAGVAAFSHGWLTWSSADPAKYVSFCIIALVASGTKVSLPSVTGTMSMNFVFMLIGISEFSLGEALATGCVGALVQSLFHAKSKPVPLQVAFNLASTACSIQIAYAVLHLPRLQSILLASTVFFAVNTLFVAAVIALTEQKDIWRVWRDSYFWTFPNYLAGASAAWVVSLTSRDFGWQPGLLLLPILYVIYRSHAMYVGRLEEAKKRAEQQKAHAEEVTALHRRTIETLALAIEAKDQTTHDHLERVEVYSAEIGKEFGFSETEMEALRAAALLHDIGKIAVPEYIISKPGKLTPAEFEKMKTHTVVGYEIAERIRFPYAVAPIVRGHHEKWNGTGYPDGLAGEQIPMGARILAAVDCLDALTSDRQYRRAMPFAEALEVLQSEAGKSFDARVVEVLVRRGLELSGMVKREDRIVRLSTAVKVERGDAPAAGFENAAPTETDARQARVLAGILAAMQQCRDRESVFAVLRSSLRDIVPYDVLAVYRRDAERLSPEYLEGDDCRMFAALEIPMGAGLSGWVAENGKAILNGNPSVEPGYLNDPAKFSALRSALAVPLVATHEITGVLSLYLKGPDAFTSDHLKALTLLSPILAGAMELTSARSPSAFQNAGTLLRDAPLTSALPENPPCEGSAGFPPRRNPTTRRRTFRAPVRSCGARDPARLRGPRAVEFGRLRSPLFPDAGHGAVPG
jgi:putative nucleotidyltransferase with HDIG domain